MSDSGKKSSPKPAVAARLEESSAALAKKRESESREDVDKSLADAESRRQKLLEERINKAKQLEGHRPVQVK